MVNIYQKNIISIFIMCFIVLVSGCTRKMVNISNASINFEKDQEFILVFGGDEMDYKNIRYKELNFKVYYRGKIVSDAFGLNTILYEFYTKDDVVFFAEDMSPVRIIRVSLTPLHYGSGYWGGILFYNEKTKNETGPTKYIKLYSSSNVPKWVSEYSSGVKIGDKFSLTFKELNQKPMNFQIPHNIPKTEQPQFSHFTKPRLSITFRGEIGKNEKMPELKRYEFTLNDDYLYGESNNPIKAIYISSKEIYKIPVFEKQRNHIGIYNENTSISGEYYDVEIYDENLDIYKNIGVAYLYIDQDYY